MKKHLVAFFIILAFFINIVSLSVVNNQINDTIKYSSMEQILFAIENPTTILSNYLANITQTSSKTSTKKNTQTNKQNTINLVDYTLTISSTYKTNILSNFFQTIVNNISTIDIITSDIQYPLKIPFLRCIFLLLILKLLFNVLPRSISINYINKNIERACIV